MLTIRPAIANDAALLKSLIAELAEFERLSHEDVITKDDLRHHGFGATPKFPAMIAK